MSRPSHSAPMLRLAAFARTLCSIALPLLAFIYFDAASPIVAQPTTHGTRVGSEPITPIPVAPIQDPKRVALGERLFHDRRLSHDETRACSSCHDVGTNGASSNARDLTPGSQPIPLNTPTVFNAALNFRLNWEGNYRTLEREVEESLRNPAIMASSAEQAVTKLRDDPDLVRQFRGAYGRDPDVTSLLN